MSPILVRPVREQLEHDRVIRLLQAKFRRRFDVGINPGSEQNSPIGGGGTFAIYPDVVLTSPDRGRKVQTVIEVETVESVNNLEALAEWVPLGRLRTSFHLYVPAAMVNVAKRLCTDAKIPVAEIHTYHWIGDEMRFLPVYKAPADGPARLHEGYGAAGEARQKESIEAEQACPSEDGGEVQPEGRAFAQGQIALPFLRFTRDTRGYETTSLVHAVRRQGRSRQRILYWFRTPPDVKVGRPALDEEAIRWIEEHNPDIEFNWQKILEAKPSAVPPAEDVRNRRIRRDRPERPRPLPSEPVVEPAGLESAFAEASADKQDPANQQLEAAEPEEELVEAIEQLTHPDAEEKIDAPLAPVEHAIGREQLIRLRARYAELQARITERGGDPERIAAMRVESESLNPDTWVTGDEARKGLEAFEPKIRDLRAALGLRRRRRSRRGPRGQKPERPENDGAPEPEKGEG